MATLSRLGEQGFIDLVARMNRRPRPRPVLGIGDDAAALDLPPRAHLLVTTDLLTDGVHFRASSTPGFLLGRKALAVNLSDIAAMGGLPHAFVVALGFPRSTSEGYARAVAAGLLDQARSHRVALVGGDTCAARALFVGVTLIGIVERGRVVRRRGARPGDGLYVTGRLGGASAGLALLRRGVRRQGRVLRGARIAPALRRHVSAAIAAQLDPLPRSAMGRALGVARLATAMLDLSDGLARDLPRLCAASGTGAVIEESAIPVAPAARALLGLSRSLRAALDGGEDYELLFSARPQHEEAIGRLARRLRLPIARIGQVLPRRSGIRLLSRDGRYRPVPSSGFEHFPRPGH